MANIPVSRNVRIRQVTAIDGNKDYRVVVIVRNDTTNVVNTVDVDFVPPYVGKPQPAFANATCLFRKALANNRKRYVDKNVDFAEDSLNKSYTMVITMKDSAGATVGKVVTRDVVVDNSGEDNDPVVPAIVDINIKQTGLVDGWYNAELEVLVNSDSSNSVSSVEVSLTTTAGRAAGPDPVPSVVVCNAAGTLGEDRRFLGVFKFATSAVGFSYTGSAAMKNAQGNTLDSVFRIADVVVE